MSDKTGGNIVDNGTISLTANSETFPVKNMIRFDIEVNLWPKFFLISKIMINQQKKKKKNKS